MTIWPIRVKTFYIFLVKINDIIEAKVGVIASPSGVYFLFFYFSRPTSAGGGSRR